MSRRALGSHVRVQILARDQYRSRMCGRSREELSLEVGDVIPVADGGTDEFQNLATLCRDYNRGKSAYRFPDYRQMDIAPADLASHFRFFQDDRPGDSERFHSTSRSTRTLLGGPTACPSSRRLASSVRRQPTASGQYRPKTVMRFYAASFGLQ